MRRIGTLTAVLAVALAAIMLLTAGAGYADAAVAPMGTDPDASPSSPLVTPEGSGGVVTFADASYSQENPDSAPTLTLTVTAGDTLLVAMVGGTNNYAASTSVDDTQDNTFSLVTEDASGGTQGTNNGQGFGAAAWETVPTTSGSDTVTFNDGASYRTVVWAADVTGYGEAETADAVAGAYPFASGYGACGGSPDPSWGDFSGCIETNDSLAAGTFSLVFIYSDSGWNQYDYNANDAQPWIADATFLAETTGLGGGANNVYPVGDAFSFTNASAGQVVAGWGTNETVSGSTYYEAVLVPFAPSGAAPPDAPTAFSVDALTSTSATFDWVQSDTPSIVNNTVSVWLGSGCSGTLLGHYSTSGPATTFGVGSLEVETDYSASVTAWNATAESGPSNCEDFTTDAPAAVTYSNATFVLPEWSCWGQYQAKPNGEGDCQTPLLSWTQDGVYYVDSSSDLTFYSFVNATAYDLGSWAILDQNIAEYNMIPNLLFITQDGSYVYTWGAATGDEGAIEVEAENVTTHEQFAYTFTGLTTEDVYTNGQVQMTGYDGNDSWLTLITAGGEVYTHNIWTDTQAETATLSFFEANNVYWVPYLNAYVNIEADGSAGDAWEEWQMPAQDGDLSMVASGTWGSDVTVNGVSGWSFNVTTRQLSLTIENYAVTFDVGPTGVITDVASATASSEDGAYPALGAVSSNERGTLVSDSPSYNIVADPSTDAFLFNPAGDVAYPASTTPYLYVDDSPNPFYGWEQYYDDGTFFNTSYFVSAESFACPFGASVFESACSVNNTAGGYAVGTIWYEWDSALPEFPYPADNPAAQLTYPTPVSTAQESFTSTSVTLDWSVPSENATPLLNYTLVWSVDGGSSTTVNLYPTVTDYTLADLVTGSVLTYCVEAWNLHFHGACVEHTWVVGGTPPSAPTFSNVAETSVTVTWTQATFPDDSAIVNDTVLVGTVLGEWTQRVSTSGAATTANLVGLSPDTTYVVEVEAWNATGFTMGNSASFSTASPAGGGLGGGGGNIWEWLLVTLASLVFIIFFLFLLDDWRRKGE